VATGGRVFFDGHNHIGGQCHFCAAADLSFGEFSGTSQGVRIYTANDDYSGRRMMGPMVPADLRGGQCAAIRLERHTAVGAGSVIMPGCHLLEGTVLGALSLLTKPTEPWSVYHGNPARRVAGRRRDVEQLEEVLRVREAVPAIYCA
jgi:galactoside O-acetyltransferase